MITGKDIYDVLAAIVPLYVAMFLAYGSVRWWGIFSPDQCSGINRFVAVFAVPLLSFHFISSNNIYAMDFQFLAADSLQKVVILTALCIWQTFSKKGSSEWMITLFSLSTLPNTLVMGIPLLTAMYGPYSGELMVQIVVLQSVIWYTLMLFMFEYRGAKLLIGEQFPETAASITSFKVESDVISLNGREPLQTDAEIGDDGRLHVVVKRSNTPSLASSRSNYYNYNKQSGRGNKNHISALASMNMTPRASNLTGIEIYSVQSSREPTPRGSSFNQNDFYAMFSSSKAASPKHGYTSTYGGGGADVYSLQSSKVATPRTSNFEEEMTTTNKNSNNNKNKKGGRSTSGELFNNGGFSYPPPNPMLFGGSSAGGLKKKEGGGGGNSNKDLHMFVWSSSASSPVSEGHLRNNNAVVHRAAATDFAVVDASKAALRREFAPTSMKGTSEFGENNNNSPGRKEDKVDQGDIEEAAGTSSKVSTQYTNNQKKVEEMEDEEEDAEGGNNKNHQMPPASVMTRLILIMVWRKLIRNPNTYSSLAGLIWSLISFRYNIQMPGIVHGSIAILSDAGLGMAMFSLGLFMALQPRIIACGKSVATFSMAVRFLTGPAVIAATSIAVGLRGVLLHVAIVQAALPQGIVPFVFAKEYNVHPDILSTAVIFGMLVALPVTILYYVLLGL